MILLLACAGKQPAPPPPEPALTAAPTWPEAVRDKMGTHFRVAHEAEEALVRGDYAGARAAVAELAESTETMGDLPLDVLREKARAAAAAEDGAGTAQGVAAVLAECGACHQGMGAARPIDVPVVPESHWSDIDTMDRHRLGAMWLWIGMIAASDEAWDVGAKQVAGASVEGGAAVQATAAKAVGARGEDRTRLYGELLLGCGACHTR